MNYFNTLSICIIIWCISTTPGHCNENSLQSQSIHLQSCSVNAENGFTDTIKLQIQDSLNNHSDKLIEFKNNSINTSLIVNQDSSITKHIKMIIASEIKLLKDTIVLSIIIIHTWIKCLNSVITGFVLLIVALVK